jgi:3-deoxy-D-manno-octulosonic-acid transferase
MPSAKVACCGNMKFDTAKDLRVQDQAKTRSLLHLSKDERLFVAGSTHPKEEEMVLGAYRKLMDSSPGLRLLIAPRHPERAHEIFGIIKRAGFDSMRVSKLGNEKPRHNKVVFILDTIGQLLNFYNIADAIFVGGSLVKKGGHNPLEPAALAKTAVFGPHMFNFRDISELLLEARAMTVAHDEEHLSGCIEILLKDPIMAGEMGERALELIRKNQGATLKCADRIKSLARNTL